MFSVTVIRALRLLETQEYLNYRSSNYDYVVEYCNRGIDVGYIKIKSENIESKKVSMDRFNDFKHFTIKNTNTSNTAEMELNGESSYSSRQINIKSSARFYVAFYKFKSFATMKNIKLN